MIRAQYILAILALACLAVAGRAEHNRGVTSQQPQFQGGSMAMGASAAPPAAPPAATAKYEKNKDVSKSQEYAKEAAKEMNEGNKSFGQWVEKASSALGQNLEKSKIPENTKLLDELAKNATNVVLGTGIGKAVVDDVVAATKAVADVRAQTVQAMALSLLPPAKQEVAVVQTPTIADKMASFVSGRTGSSGGGGRSPLAIASTAQPIGNARQSRGIASMPSMSSASGRGMTSVDPGLTYKAPRLPSRN